MKKTMIFGLALGLTITATAAMAGVPKAGGTGIVGSYHDLGATYDTQSRICVFCHHPHNSIKPDTREDYMPLWNHDLSTNTTFTQYSNGAGPTSGRNMLNADFGTAPFVPGGVSLLCLSCHDGSVALNAYSSTSTSTDTGSTNNGGSAATIGAANRARIGTGGDLSNHHPIGFDYTSIGTSDPEIAVVGKTIATGTTIGELLYGGTQFECVTCHDVHNSQNAAGAEKFLWTTNDKSAFCLVCHEK